MATTTTTPAVETAAGSTDRRRPGRHVLLLLALIVIAGGWLRFASLGRLSFWADEIPHAVGARSMLETGRPTLPSGREYRRALPQTIAVAASMAVLGENERAARVPSAVVGVATIAVLWFLVRRRLGDTAALAAAAALALMPLHVAHSRSARFYAAFVLAYGLAAVATSRAIETRARRDAILAAVAFAAAMTLQVSAGILLAPLAAHALWRWRRADGDERRARARVILFVGAGLVLVATVMLSVPSVRGSSLRLLREPVPGLRFGPGLHADTLFQPFAAVSWWAWIVIAPLAILGLRRAGTWGGLVPLHLVAPTALIAILYEGSAGVGTRYLLHVLPFVAAVVGVGCAEGARLLATAFRRSDGRRWTQPVAVGAGALIVAGVFSVWHQPTEAHPTELIPRPNWNAAGALFRAEARPGDALLSTSPFAMSWVSGRCGEWIRETSAAAVYMVDGRDIYCGTTLVPDAPSLERYFAAHPHGWLIADPRQWSRIIDPAAVALMERTARPVDAGDSSVIVMRWDLGAPS